jgi:hypothetical protein
MSEKMKMSENMEIIFTHSRNLLEIENSYRVKIAKKSTFYEIPKWVTNLWKIITAKRASSWPRR